MTLEYPIFMECQKMNLDPKNLSARIIDVLKLRKMQAENPHLQMEYNCQTEENKDTLETGKFTDKHDILSFQNGM